jgi:prepilin-type N-terminal cleavage/methylation domain-containing protein/prepilin-type processing-associated H-X9-DG protein
MVRLSRRNAVGFTLVELLTVLAIIGLLAALVFPTVGRVRESAQRAVDASNLREIVKAAQLYAAENHDRLPDPSAAGLPVSGGTGPHLWAGLLAERGLLTEPALYFSRQDPRFDGRIPAAIVGPGDRAALDADFASAPALAVELVGGLRLGDAPHTPVAFTRGLLASGRWSAEHGVYRDAGGHIAFLDGHVRFYPNTTEAAHQLTLADGRKGRSVLQALPSGANAASTPKVYATPPAGVGSLAGTLADRPS